MGTEAKHRGGDMRPFPPEEESEMTPLKGETKEKKGLTLLTGSLFMLGELISIAFLVLPRSMVDMGVSGLPLLIVLSTVSAYTAIILTQCWDIVEERYGLYGHVNDPYSTIAFHAAGRFGRIFVTITNMMSLNGVAIVSIILSGQLLHNFFSQVWPSLDLSFCLWMVLFAGLLAPLTWLGTPKDMGAIAFCSYASLGTSCVLVVVMFILLVPDAPTPTVYPKVTITSFMLGFGKLAYSNKGHIGIPTIQVDMEDRRVFYKAVIVGFVLVTIIYLPVAYTGYFLFGDKAEVDILVTLNALSPGSKIVMVVQILVVVHNAAVSLIYFNPVFQHLEGMFGIKNAFGLWRVLIRTLLLLVILFICETMPRFGNVISLLGGSTLTLLVYVLPLVFYERLCGMKGDADWPQRSMPIYQRIFHYVIILVAIFAGVATTYSSMWATFSPDTWVTPCYLNTTVGHQDTFQA